MINNFPLLQTDSVSKFYGNYTALENVSLNIPEGSVFGLLGPNGAGKTSLIRIINQITLPDTGRIFFKGSPLSPKHIHQIGYLPEERGLYKKMEVGEQLIYLGQLKGLSKNQVYENCKYWVEKFEIGSWWKRKLDELSKGMQQKVQFIATVMHNPTLLILDEPFTGFDPINASLIRDEIIELNQKGVTIIFSTHRMESVEQMCDHIALIHKSHKILDGKVEDIIGKYKENMYEVTYEGDHELQASGYDIISRGMEGHYRTARIRLEEGVSPNKLLSNLIAEVEVHFFREELPSVHDIFIRAVKEY